LVPFGTTHVGSLPRGPRLAELLLARELDAPFDHGELDELLARSVTEVVRRQVELAIDSVSDGEMSKVSWTSNYVEHPELVAQRLERFAAIAGAERVMAGTDCGFGTFAGIARVDPEIAYKKLGALVEGARMASWRAEAVA